MTDEPVDVIMVNYLTGELARAAVDRVAAPGTTVWLVDNSGELLADPPASAVLLGDGSNRMYAGASNLAYRAGSAEHVLLLNPDVTVGPEDVAVMRQRLHADPALWGVAPRLGGPDGRSQPYLRGLPTLAGLLADLCPPLRRILRRSYERYRRLDLAGSTGDVEVEQPAAACLLVRRSLVGPRLFDDSYRLFFNDADLARRMSASGRRCLVLGSVTVPHVGGASIEAERARSGSWVADEYDRAALRYARRNLTGWQLLAPLIWIRYVARRLVRG